MAGKDRGGGTLSPADRSCGGWIKSFPRFCCGTARADTGRPVRCRLTGKDEAFAEALGREIAAKVAELTRYPFVTAPDTFAARGSLDAMVAATAAVRGLAVALIKIANDMRGLASGPRCGLGEPLLPENEPGSSIMPGKVNPTQQEAMVMVCIQVIGEDNAVAFAGSQGNFELNAMRPIIINNFLHSARILGDACEKLRCFSVEGTRLNRSRIDEMVNRSLMLVTALSPVIGYDKASAIAHKANDEDLTLKEAALASGYIDEKRFDEIVDPKKMVGHGIGGS
jgi:fumarate hydratase, class II